MDLNSRLKSASKTVDAGVAITVSDGYVGQAPDWGAIEVGKAVRK